MIDKIGNTIVNDKIKSVYSYNDYTIQDLLSKFFEKINECVDSSNLALDFLNWLKGEGLEKEVIKEIELMYSDGRLTQLINNLVEGITNKVEGLETKVNTFLNVLPSSNLNFKGAIIDNKPFPYMCWVFGTGFYDESIDKMCLFINGKSSHTSTDGAIYFMQKNSLDDSYSKLIKVGENIGKGTITHAGGICANGDYICIAKITTNGNESIEQSVIYRSSDKGNTWVKHNFNVDNTTNPIFDGYGGVYKTQDNSLLTYARELDSSKFYMLKSLDNGYTWVKKEIINTLVNEDVKYREIMEGNTIQMTDGTLMCVLRVRLMTNAFIKDCAILTYSYDNGESWTPFKKSSTWLDLSSNNCSMISHKDNKSIEVVFGSRLQQQDGKGSLFTFVVSEENAKKDLFPKPTRIFKGEIDGDFGYPSLIKDKNNIVNLFFYNKDDNGTNIYYAKGGVKSEILEQKELSIKKDIYNKSIIKDAYFLREYVDLETVKHNLPLRHLYYLKNANVKNIYDSTVTSPQSEIILDVPTIMGMSWLNKCQGYLVEVLLSNKVEGTESDFNEVVLVPSNGLSSEISKGRVLWNGTQLISQQVLCNTNFGEGTLKLCLSKPTNVKLLKIKLLGFYII